MQQAVPSLECASFNFPACIQEHILQVTGTWFANGMQVAEVIFFALLGLEIVVSGYNALRKAGDPGEVLKLALVKLLAMGFLWLLLKFATQWMGSSLLNFPVDIPTQAAAGLTGEPVLTASRVFKLAFLLFADTWKHLPSPGVGWNAVFGIPTYLVSMLLVFISAIVVMGSYIKLGVDLLKAIIECYFSVGAGIVLIGFLSFRGTAPLGEGILRYVITSALRLFFLCMIVYFCYQVGHALMHTLAQFGGIFPDESNLHTTSVQIGMLNTCLAMLLLAFLTLGLSGLPNQMAQSITQGLTINIKGFLQNL